VGGLSFLVDEYRISLCYITSLHYLLWHSSFVLRNRPLLFAIFCKRNSGRKHREN